jgi:ferredoxin--NADP+ reductase
MEEKMRATSDRVLVTTDDGSYGMKGLVTDAIQKLVDEGEKINLVVAIGPPIMMKFVSLLTKKFDIPTLVSLNTIMVDGTGMCGACRVTVGDQTKFVCVDGPEFDGHKVDFDEMMKRLRAYESDEKTSRERYEQGCCGKHR